MDAVSARMVVFIGPLAALSRRTAARLVADRSGTVRRGLTRRTDLVIFGQGSLASYGLDRLQAKVDAALTIGATCWSETNLLRALDLAPPAPAVARPFDAAAVSARSGLPLTTLRLLSLLDVVEADRGRYGLSEVAAAAAAARLLQEGVPMANVAAGLVRARQGRRPPADVVRREDGSLGVRFGGGVADPDGQLRLPLAMPADRPCNPTVDALFEAAEAAEAEQRWDAAERLYRRCMDLDRLDPTAPFNLANVLGRRGRLAEAAFLLQLAVSLDPSFAEAWYNLAHVSEAQGRAAGARDALAKALAVDPDYGDALYNAALLHFRDGDCGRAADLWNRYLAVDPAGVWARRARAGLGLCARSAESAQRP